MKNNLQNEVKKDKKLYFFTTTGFELTTYAIKPEHLVAVTDCPHSPVYHWAMGAVGDSGLKVQYKLAHVRYTPS